MWYRRGTRARVPLLYKHFPGISSILQVYRDGIFLLFGWLAEFLTQACKMVGIEFNDHITHTRHLCIHGFSYLVSKLRRPSNRHLWVNFDAQFYKHITSMFTSCHSSNGNSRDVIGSSAHRFKRLCVEIMIEQFMAGFHADLHCIEQDEKGDHQSRNAIYP